MTVPRDIQHTEAPAPGGASSQPPKQPQNHNSVLVKLIENIAKNEPERPFQFIPSGDKAQDGWKPVTFVQLNNAINYMAHSLSNTITRSPDDEEFPTIAYIGSNDMRYTVMLFACIKAGFKALFISPRNTPMVQLSLFEATRCNALYYSESMSAAISPCLDQLSMQSFTIESLDHFLNVESSPFPYNRSIDQSRFDPLVVLHTSGSTGIPKPIVVKQGSLYVLQNLIHKGSYQGCSYSLASLPEGTKILVSMPMFHAAGVVGSLTGIITGTTAIMPLPNKPLSVDSVLECLEISGAQAVILPPSIVEGIAATDKGVEALIKLYELKYAGGALSPAVGNMLVEKGVKLRNLIGSTESFPYALYASPDPNLWQYFVFDSEFMGLDWRPCGENLYECVICRKDLSDPGNQSVFYTFPELSEWSTKDIYQPHPTLKDHWLHMGRADDIIVFSNGEKLNPVSIESAVSGHPLVKGALVVGEGRFQAALIIEPVDEAHAPKDEAETEAFIDQVWPAIEQANSETVAHGRITRNLVAVADPSLPFARAGKETVQRAATVKLYKDFIEALYEKAEMNEPEDQSAALDFESEAELAHSIISVFQTKLGVDNLEPDTDFFSAGVDSLQVMTATKVLKSALRSAKVETSTFTTQVVYRYPTAQQLARHFISLRDGSADHDDVAKEIKETERLVAKYTENLPASKANKMPPKEDNQTVLLTGSTGSLGAYMLDTLCKLSTVKNIVALNRPDDGGASRQPSINKSRGLTQDFSKVEFLHADLSLPDMGLGQAKYDALLASADRIIHNAWPVNFNISVSSFESSIRGVRHLVDFAAAADKDVPIVFVSSIGTADGWRSSDRVPEERLTDMTLPQMGYGRSKLAATLILDAAVEQSGIHAASVRVGQIAGPRGEKGMWNRQEFIPSLIASSVYLGVLPDSLGPQQEIAWTPVEDISGLILDIAGITDPKPLSEINGYFHGVNPSETNWSVLAPAAKNFYGDGMKIISLEEWVERLEASAKDKDVDVERNPGIKLVDTYRGLLESAKTGRVMRFSMERTKGHSPTIREAGPVTPELMVNWCRQWGY